MELSARNQLPGTVKSITLGAVMAECGRTPLLVHPPQMLLEDT